MNAALRVSMHVALLLAILALSAPFARAAPDNELLSGTIVDIFDKGGPVMYVIVAGSILGLALAFERCVALRLAMLLPKDLVSGVRQATEAGRIEEISRLIEGRNEPLARILAAGLKVRSLGPDQVERAMENTGTREVARLRRPVRPIAVLATVEPLLGLLGTVLGMVSTFNVLHHTAVAERVDRLAPGIGQALYTTVGGLCAAIPFVLFHHYLAGRVTRAADEWSALGSDVVLHLALNRGAPAP